jgi:hypothetical protein
MDRFLYCLKVAYFFFWRAWFAFSCWFVKQLPWGCPGWFVNAVGVVGSGLAFKMLRFVGWDPLPSWERKGCLKAASKERES